MKTIKSKREFETVFSTGRRINAPLVRIIYLENEDEQEGRVAFVAAKRLGNAVYRNRCKRLLREASRRCGLPSAGCSVIIFATRKTHDAALEDIVCDLSKILGKAGVVVSV
jgi:ribonuclease P protein component